MSNGADSIVDVACSYIGIEEGTPEHERLIDYYNANTGGYDMSYYDAWCACFVSVCSLKAGTVDATGTSVNCDEFESIFEEKGIRRDGSDVPSRGWLIIYDWQGDGQNDHIGIVADCDGETVHVIEGNKHDAVGERWIGICDGCISCYGAPDYGDGCDASENTQDGDIDTLAQCVIAGVYGDGDSRREALGNRYDEVQSRVNEILSGDKSIEPSPTDGSGSAEIREVQEWCNAFGYEQPIDGVNGELTKGGLRHALECVNGDEYPLVERGDTGDAVKVLQGALICLGYSTGGFDGVFGECTESAVSDYQSRHNLDVDGQAGNQTFGSLLG